MHQDSSHDLSHVKPTDQLTAEQRIGEYRGVNGQLPSFGCLICPLIADDGQQNPERPQDNYKVQNASRNSP